MVLPTPTSSAIKRFTRGDDRSISPDRRNGWTGVRERRCHGTISDGAAGRRLGQSSCMQPPCRIAQSPASSAGRTEWRGNATARDRCRSVMETINSASYSSFNIVLPNAWKNGAFDVGTDQDQERYRVKVVPAHWRGKTRPSLSALDLI